MPQPETWTRYLPAALRDRLEGRPSLWRLLTNIGWLFADRILRLGVGLLVSVWIARYLGKEQFGALSYALAYVGLFTPLALLGLDQVVVRDLVHQPTDGPTILGTSFVLKLIAGVLAFCAATVVVLAFKPESDVLHGLVLLAGAMLFFQAFDVVDFWFQAHVRSKYSVLARNASFLIVATVRLILILVGAPLVAFAGAVALEAALSAIFLLIVYRWSGERLWAWRVARNRASNLLKTSWPLILTGMAIAVYMRIDQIMLGEMLDDAQVGIYSAAVRISEVWYFIPVAIVSTVAPAIAMAKKSDEARYRHRMQQLLSMMALLGYAVAIPVTFLAGPLVRLFYGSEYAEAGIPLAIHIWAGVFVNLGGALSLWLINEGRTGYFSVSTAMGAVLNVTLNLFLIPTYGATGAAVATLIAYGTTVSVFSFIYGPTRPLARMIWKALLLARQ